ncbi:bacillithiol biosynthesis deacetylase BshB1 [Natranaerofaba carboxydovora]|uniref:bacillithiol biosynthesis deacetylase BshB1 n=1 Tax=Natranaerofaba carboxydovora TaxID=2742683 RepID=UPI001F147191|nr:bacillithiol biosynthesis deacetylase BshB1 [Natranaerofaba carboxydovora]UMZ73226.1 N-acetyl-alpha-D-glucosaminyl L-malate deacetylase 1 [Natranaerofaba carboxydovora]
MELDIMAFGAHPDDCEIGIGGVLALHADKGYKVGICDLTQGEMSTNGDIELRKEEANEAAKILKLEVRENAKIPDGFVRETDKYVDIVIGIIRKYRPRIVLAPFYEDHHPDHINASKLVKRAAHLSGLERYPVDGQKFRPKNFYYYFLGQPQNPGLVVDTTGYEETKLESIAAHRSQLGLMEEAKMTRLTEFDLLKRIEARDRYMGYFVDSEFGEGLVPVKACKANDLTLLGG